MHCVHLSHLNSVSCTTIYARNMVIIFVFTQHTIYNVFIYEFEYIYFVYIYRGDGTMEEWFYFIYTTIYLQCIYNRINYDADVSD